MNRRFGKNDILLLGMLAVVILVFLCRNDLCITKR